MNAYAVTGQVCPRLFCPLVCLPAKMKQKNCSCLLSPPKGKEAGCSALKGFCKDLWVIAAGHNCREIRPHFCLIQLNIL